MQNQHMYGRVREYSKKDGYGFIHGEDNQDIFCSSYNFKNARAEKNICVGAIVKYNVTEREGKLCANEIEIVNRYPEGNMITLPNGTMLKLKHIYKYGYMHGTDALQMIGVNVKQAEEHGHKPAEFDFIYIATEYDEYRFFQTGTCVQGDGQCDLGTYYVELKKKLLWLV